MHSNVGAKGVVVGSLIEPSCSILFAKKRRLLTVMNLGNRFTAEFYAPLTHSSRQTGSLRQVSGFGGIYTPSTMR